MSGKGASFVSGKGSTIKICAKEMTVNMMRGRSTNRLSKVTTAGATIDAMRANVVTPLTPTFLPSVGNNSPENKYNAGIVP